MQVSTFFKISQFFFEIPALFFQREHSDSIRRFKINFKFFVHVLFQIFNRYTADQIFLGWFCVVE
jgi:hypothetical protein